MDKYKQALAPGTTLRSKKNVYTIEKVLGQGSFGITYCASTFMKGGLGQAKVRVALKEFFAEELDVRSSDGSVSPRAVNGIAHRYAKAFQRESENLSKMDHPGIVRVLEFFEANGTFYYSMEYLSGGSLDAKVRGVGMPEAEALPLIAKIGDALSYMHGQKMIHLDLKPGNVVLQDDGSPVIIDFGLSKQYDKKGNPESSTTIGGGTPGYAPIEQANQSSGKSFQPTLDIYALGATLFKMLTGYTPPVASSIIEDGFPESELLARHVSDKTVGAIREAMRPSRKDRPQTVEAFLSILGVAASSKVDPEKTVIKHDPEPEPEPEPKPKPKPKRKNWLWWLLGGIAAAIVAIALIVIPKIPGSLYVFGEPYGASIYLDGQDTGRKIPTGIKGIKPGSHRLRVRNEGYYDTVVNVEVVPGRGQDVRVYLKEKE